MLIEASPSPVSKDKTRFSQEIVFNKEISPMKSSPDFFDSIVIHKIETDDSCPTAEKNKPMMLK